MSYLNKPENRESPKSTHSFDNPSTPGGILESGANNPLHTENARNAETINTVIFQSDIITHSAVSDMLQQFHSRVSALVNIILTLNIASRKGEPNIPYIPNDSDGTGTRQGGVKALGHTFRLMTHMLKDLVEVIEGFEVKVQTAPEISVITDGDYSNICIQYMLQMMYYLQEAIGDLMNKLNNHMMINDALILKRSHLYSSIPPLHTKSTKLSGISRQNVSPSEHLILQEQGTISTNRIPVQTMVCSYEHPSTSLKSEGRHTRNISNRTLPKHHGPRPYDNAICSWHKESRNLGTQSDDPLNIRQAPLEVHLLQQDEARRSSSSEEWMDEEEKPVRRGSEKLCDAEDFFSPKSLSHDFIRQCISGHVCHPERKSSQSNAAILAMKLVDGLCGLDSEDDVGLRNSEARKMENTSETISEDEEENLEPKNWEEWEIPESSEFYGFLYNPGPTGIPVCRGFILLPPNYKSKFELTSEESDDRHLVVSLDLSSFVSSLREKFHEIFVPEDGEVLDSRQVAFEILDVLLKCVQESLQWGFKSRAESKNIETEGLFNEKFEETPFSNNLKQGLSEAETSNNRRSSTVKKPQIAVADNSRTECFCDRTQSFCPCKAEGYCICWKQKKSCKCSICEGKKVRPLKPKSNEGICGVCGFSVQCTGAFAGAGREKSSRNCKDNNYANPNNNYPSSDIFLRYVNHKPNHDEDQLEQEKCTVCSESCKSESTEKDKIKGQYGQVKGSTQSTKGKDFPENLTSKSNKNSHVCGSPADRKSTCCEEPMSHCAYHCGTPEREILNSTHPIMCCPCIVKTYCFCNQPVWSRPCSLCCTSCATLSSPQGIGTNLVDACIELSRLSLHIAKTCLSNVPKQRNVMGLADFSFKNDASRTLPVKKPSSKGQSVKFESTVYQNINKTCVCCAEDIEYFYTDVEDVKVRAQHSLDSLKQPTVDILHSNHDVLPQNVVEVREIVNEQLRVYTEECKKEEHDLMSSRWYSKKNQNQAESGENVQYFQENPSWMLIYTNEGLFPRKVPSEVDVRTACKIKEIPVPFQPPPACSRGKTRCQTLSWPGTFPVTDAKHTDHKYSPGIDCHHANKLWIFHDDMRRARYKEGPPLVLKLRRNRVLEESLQALMCLSRIPLKYYRELKVYFKNEDGLAENQDKSQEFFSLLSKHLFSHDFHKLFDSPSDASKAIHLNPHSSASPELFQFAGVIFALSLIHQKPIGVKFPIAFFKCLLERPFTLKDLEEIDPPLYQKLRWLQKNKLSRSNVRMTFTVKDKRGTDTYYKELVSEGENVIITDSNKAGYIELAVKWKLGERYLKPLLDFRRGVVMVLDPCLLSIFTAEELQYIIGRHQEDGILTTQSACPTYTLRKGTW